MGDNDIYYVEKILDRRKVNDRLEYKIKWEGYPMNQSTWEPLENLRTAMELVEEYDREHPFPKKLTGKKKNRAKKEEVKEELTERIVYKIQPVQEKKEETEQPKEEEQNKNINLDESMPTPVINQNQEDNVRKYIVDNSLEKVITVRKKDNKLMAIVKKKKSNDDSEEVEIETFKLRNENPWILLDFYESKIKFT